MITDYLSIAAGFFYFGVSVSIYFTNPWRRKKSKKIQNLGYMHVERVISVALIVLFLLQPRARWSVVNEERTVDIPYRLTKL